MTMTAIVFRSFTISRERKSKRDIGKEKSICHECLIEYRRNFHSSAFCLLFPSSFFIIQPRAVQSNQFNGNGNFNYELKKWRRAKDDIEIDCDQINIHSKICISTIRSFLIILRAVFFLFTRSIHDSRHTRYIHTQTNTFRSEPLKLCQTLVANKKQFVFF